MASCCYSSFDSHCHLQSLPDPAAAAARALRCGVGGFAVCATREDDWGAVLALAGVHHSAVCPALGVHPFWAGGVSSGWDERLRSLLVRHPDAGVGEVGLDRSPRCSVPLDQQEAVCMAQLRMAREMDRPVSAHCVQSHGRFLELCRAAGGPFSAGLVLHAYSGSAELVGPFSELNAFFSFGGAFTRSPPGSKSRRAAAAVPLGRLLVETDSPDGMPSPASLRRAASAGAWGGSPGVAAAAAAAASAADGAAAAPGHACPSDGINEPAFLPACLLELAAARGEPLEAVSGAVLANALRIFRRIV
jgi:TatD DNase family protein